jgi:hypothetical protein
MATTPRARANTSPKRPMAIIMAHSEGMSSADEWLDRSADTKVTTIPAADWRARAFADFVQKHQNRRDLFQLLGEWERGFDVRLSEAEAYKQSTLPSSHANSIKRICDDANTVAALLSVVDVLPQADQRSALVTCAAIARGVSSDLDLLVRGAA